MDAAAVQTASRVAVAWLLGAALAVPMALVSIWRRGDLPGLVALLALVVVTQIITANGAGAWFPCAAPALWMGMRPSQDHAHGTAGRVGTAGSSNPRPQSFAAENRP